RAWRIKSFHNLRLAAGDACRQGGSGIGTRQGGGNQNKYRGMGRRAGFKSQIEDGIEEYHKVQTQDDRPVLAQGLRMAEGKEKLSDHAIGHHTDESGHISQGFTEAKKNKKADNAQEKGDQTAEKNGTTGQ